MGSFNIQMIMPARLSFPALLVLVSGFSCTGSDRSRTGWSSTAQKLPSGADLVINIPGSAGPIATFIAEEEIRIGTRSIGGPISFGRIRQLAALPDGRIAVLDGMAEELRIFSPDGNHERTFGGSGAGPGELKGAQGVLLGPDGLLRVPEQGNARISFFHADSGFVDSRHLYLYTTAGSGPWRATQDASGKTLVWSSGRYKGGLWLMIRVYDENMVQVDSIPHYDYTNRNPRTEPGFWPMTLPNGMRSGLGIPYYGREEQVLAPTGEIWSSPGGNTGMKVTRWQPGGDTTLIVESRRPLRPVTEAERDSVVEAIEQRLVSWPARPRLDYGQIPETKPPLYDLALDDRARLWVRVTAPEEDTTVYDVFGTDGSHAETVLVPARVDPDIPPLVEGDLIWSVVRDETDVQYVIRARLKDAPSPGA